MSKNWHARMDWKADTYFRDPQVIALCQAIEANDLAEIDRLLAAGADANALGKGNMTPLLWAFPDGKLERFRRLLEHGADPNVIVTSDFGTRGAIQAGDSVTHLATGTTFPGYFEAVFSHGGDPNLERRTRAIGMGDTPLFTMLRSPVSRKREKLQTLVALGADLDHINGGEATPAMTATSWGGQYDLALQLLEAGADPSVYSHPQNNRKLVHLVLLQQNREHLMTPQQKRDYRALTKWLDDHGESLAEAKKDLNRWASYKPGSENYVRLMLSEVAIRRQAEQLPAAEIFFNDPQVVALCQAIDKNDLPAIDALIADGVDVNATGKGGMTPLLRACPMPWETVDKPERLSTFTRLLQHGASPNFAVRTESNMRGMGLYDGDTLMYLVATTPASGYLEAALSHGGDPNLNRNSIIEVEPPLFSVIRADLTDKPARIRLLASEGADLDATNRDGTAAVYFAARSDQYDCVLALLQAGATYRPVPPDKWGLIHTMVNREKALEKAGNKTRREYQAALQWLVYRNESIKAAKALIGTRTRDELTEERRAEPL